MTSLYDWHGAVTDNTLAVRLFGPFAAWIGGEAVVGLHRREGARLFAYLILRAGEPVSYRELAERFWPSEAALGTAEARTFPNTRQAVHYLRVALGDHAYRLRSTGRGLLLFDLRGAGVDVVEFDRIVQQNDTEAMPTALNLHSRPLLEDWNDDWVVDARRTRQRSYDRIRYLLKQEARHSDPHHEPAISGLNSAAFTETPGGAVPLNSPYYVVRDADARFIDAIDSGTSTVLLKADARMGKSSLLARGLHQARSKGSTVALTDFQTFSTSQFDSSAELFRAMAASLALQLDIDFDPSVHWSPHFGPGTNLEQFLRRHVLSKIEGTLVWGMDEIDRLFRYAYSGELFGLMRSWHNRRAMDPAGPWMRLTLVLAYSTETALFIADQSQSPFNIGTQVTLTDFTLAEQQDLNGKYGSPLAEPHETVQLHSLLQGHPFLTRRALQEIVVGNISFEDVVSNADRENGPFGQDLHKLTSGLAADSELAVALRRVVEGKPCGDRASFYRLRSAGIVKGEWNVSEQIRCPLYAAYFRRHLVPQT